MGLSILSNIPSLEAQNQLAITNQNLQNTLFQLSSGSKINSGADDPAGLSIADGLQANISALTQSAQNVTDGVGMLQTADGALSQVTTLLNRAVTLATEAGNAGLTADEQNALQTEYASITQEINQVGSNTTYNNNQVFTNQLTSVFLSDGSQVDSADPTISVTIPQLSASALGLSSYATGTLDLTANPNVGNTVQIGQQVYTFVASGNANATGDVALGSNVQGTLQNLQAAVNGTGTASPGTYGVGTGVNQLAQITSVNGGSATVQATTAGSAGNNVQLVTNLTSSGGTTGTDLAGAVNATNTTGTLTLNAQPGIITTATGTYTMNALPDTITNATGVLNLTAGQPTAAVNATGTLNLAGGQPVTGNATGVFTLTGQPTAGDTMTIGTATYTFTTSGSATALNDVAISTVNFQGTLDNLMNAVNNNGIGSATTFDNGGVANTKARITSDAGGVASIQALAANDNTIGLAEVVSGGKGAVSGATLTGGTTADTIALGGMTYTFVAAGLATAGNEIALGGSQNATLLNLQAALAGGAGSVATYHVSGANNAVSIGVATNLATVTATTAGVGSAGTGNATVFTATGSIVGDLATTGVGTLGGGVNGDTITVGAQLYSFVASGDAFQANDVALGTGGSAINATLNDLMNAINGTGSAGVTTFGMGTSPVGTATMFVAPSATTGTLTATTAGVGGAGTGNGVVLTATGSIATDVGPLGTLSGGAAADTVTIGGTTYTFVASGQALAADQVALGANVQATLTHLEEAVNGIGVGTNTTYGVGTGQNATALISSISNGVATVEAATGGVADPGAAGNAVPLTTSSATGSATVSGTGTLAGGANADTVTLGTVTYTFVGAGNATAGNEVALGATAQDTLDNLTAAVNSTASASGTAATYHLLNDTMLQGATGVTIASDTSGVATVEALTAGVLASGIGLNGVFAGGDTTATFGGLTANHLSGGSATTAATGIVDLAAQPTANDTLTIGATTYTFVAAGGAVGGHNDVALGATVNATLQNLQLALLGGAGSAGTFHTVGNAANASASITSVDGGQAVVTDLAAGAAGNAVALSSSFTNTANVAGTPGGGAAASQATGLFDLTGNPSSGNTVTVGNETYTFVSTTPAAAYQVAIGETANGTLNNLQAAVNAGAGAGTDYGTGTVANTSATITAVSGGQATVTAITAGTTGNSIALSAELSNGAGGGVVGTSNSKLAGGGASASLSSASNAQAALTIIAGAISSVASTRGAIGSSINQMNAAVQVMNNTSQNLTSSMSGIQDANIGQVVAKMSKYQVLEQTGIAALTQANQQEQIVLKLLQ